MVLGFVSSQSLKTTSYITLVRQMSLRPRNLLCSALITSMGSCFHIDFDLLMSHYPVSSFKVFKKIYVFILNLAPLVIFSERVSSNNLSQHIFRHKTSSLIFHLSFPPSISFFYLPLFQKNHCFLFLVSILTLWINYTNGSILAPDTKHVRNPCSQKFWAQYYSLTRSNRFAINELW